MHFDVEPFVAANRAFMDFGLEYCRAVLTSTERIVALNLGTTRSLLQDSMSSAKALLAVQDANAAAAIQANAAKDAADTAVAYARSMQEIAVQAQDELTKMAKARAGDYQASTIKMMEAIMKSAPAGAESAVAAIQSAIAAANTNFSATSSAAKRLRKAA